MAKRTKLKRYIKRRLIRPLWRYGPKAWWARYRYLLPSRFKSADGAAWSPCFESGGKLVSVLLPSRGYPQGLLHAVSSLVSRCTDLQSIEILIRLDDDDTESQKVVELINGVYGSQVAIRAIIGLRGNGYGDLHKFVNELCAVSKGDFLLLFNDDAVMDTECWDIKFARFRNEFCVLRLWSPIPRDVSYHTAFPAVHRKVYQVIGHLSGHHFYDTWIRHISWGAGIERRCGVSVTHKQRHKAPSNDTARGEGKANFKSAELAQMRETDLERVKSYISRHGVRLQRKG